MDLNRKANSKMNKARKLNIRTPGSIFIRISEARYGDIVLIGETAT